MSENANADNIKKAIFNLVKGVFGFVPNILKEVGKSICALKIYTSARVAFEHSTLTLVEINAVQLAVSYKNDCFYCIRAHTVAGKKFGADPEHISALQRGELPADTRIANLVTTAWLLMDKQGHLDKDDLEDIEVKGISRAELYDLVAIIAVKTITNYINHIAQTEVDEGFAD
jgi:AhpD family alkylhydroperoxidase